MQKKLTIGLFNDSFYPFTDGVVKVLDNYAKRLSKYANVIVFAPSYSNVEYDDSKFPYKVIRCKSIKIPTVEYNLPLTKMDIDFNIELNECDLDIVHIHSPFAIGAAGVKYAQKHNIPCIATMHSQFKRDFKQALKNELLAEKLNNNLIKVFNKCDECWAVNDKVGELYYKEYGYKTIPRTMPNATEFTPVDEKEAKTFIHKKYHIKKNEKIFLFVGRINTVKNILFIVDSLKILKEKNPKLKFKMLFVGSGPDEEKLKQQIKENKLKKEIILCGKITDMKELSYHYKASDLFLFPSLYDASSIVQIEAASQSTPTLFLKDAITAATVTDNVNGFLSENSREDFAKKIIEIISDNNLYSKVAENAFKQLYKTWDEIVDEAYKLYIEAIEHKKKQIRKGK